MVSLAMRTARCPSEAQQHDGKMALESLNYAMNPAHSGVTALAQGGKRGAAERADYRGR
jgi:hypothetical protein